LAVVNVANRADVDVRFCTLKLFLCHSSGALLRFGGPLVPWLHLRARDIWFKAENQAHPEGNAPITLDFA
ncbi:hypothetical protein, partial [uncultured Ruegeria sp.]|uniref:hypothetical protein n=1 Tax=uncultured Ruegeria sp. TaxID=259304 RepID=UPI00345055A6